MHYFYKKIRFSAHLKKMLYFSKSGQKKENFPKMPHFQAVTNHTEESQQIKVRGVLETFPLDILSPIKFIP
jgi:hypothetical protein